MEAATNLLPFLDTSIHIENDSFATQVYRKPSSTGIVLNYNCVAPIKWKQSLVKCLLNRAYRISSNYEFFINETKVIRSILTKNDYPIKFVDDIMVEFVKAFNINSRSFKNDLKKPEETIKDPVSEDRTKEFFTIPYFGKPSKHFQGCIRKELQNYEVSITVAYRTTKVSSYFSLKSRCSELFQSNVIYKFNCSQDEKISYIGETRRQFFKRVEEHTTTDKQSAVFEHLYSCTDCQKVGNIVDCFKVIKSCNRYNIFTVEAMMIDNNKPILNTQLGPEKGTLTSLVLY